MIIRIIAATCDRHEHREAEGDPAVGSGHLQLYRPGRRVDAAEHLHEAVCRRADLAELVLHVAKVEGDGAAYDIKSYTLDGEEKFIEVKTTRGDKSAAFYLSSNEARFAADHTDSCYLYRVFEFDQTTSSGKVFVHHGDFQAGFSILPTQFRALPAFD